MNNYKKLFEQISPTESDEALISKVRARKAENMKNKSSKSIHFRKAAVISAAAVLAVGVVTELARGIIAPEATVCVTP